MPHLMVTGAFTSSGLRTSVNDNLSWRWTLKAGRAAGARQREPVRVESGFGGSSLRDKTAAE